MHPQPARVTRRQRRDIARLVRILQRTPPHILNQLFTTREIIEAVPDQLVLAEADRIRRRRKRILEQQTTPTRPLPVDPPIH